MPYNLFISYTALYRTHTYSPVTITLFYDAFYPHVPNATTRNNVPLRTRNASLSTPGLKHDLFLSRVKFFLEFLPVPTFGRQRLGVLLVLTNLVGVR